MSRSVVKLEFKCFFNKFIIIIIFLDSIETRPEQFIDRFSVYIITWVYIVTLVQSVQRLKGGLKILRVCNVCNV